MTTQARLTRRALVRTVRDLQGLTSEALALLANDRDPHGLTGARKLLGRAFNVCVDALTGDPPPRKPGPHGPTNVHRCSRCGVAGHNRRTCRSER